MLRRLNVRTRLMAVIAVPLVLLLAVAVPEALQRLDRAAEADRATAATEDVALVAAAIDALQAERTLTAAHAGGAAAEVRGVLDAQRGRTDGAVQRAGPALQRLAGLDRSLVGVIQQARVALADLGGVRDASDGVEATAWVDGFTPVIGRLLDVEEATAIAVATLGFDGGLRGVVLLERLKDAASAQSAIVVAAAAGGSLDDAQAEVLRALRADEAAYRVAYLSAAPPELRADRRAQLTAGAGTSVGLAVDELDGGSPVVDLGVWLDRANERQEVIREAEDERAAEALAAARRVATESRRSATGYLTLSGAALLLVLSLALAVARSITRPLRTLTVAADRLAKERLPALVDTLQHPVTRDDEHYLTATLEPIDVDSNDELARLAHAFNAVQSVAVEVAAEQSSLLKKGISDLYVNLARRNQALIERQIQLLDHLEAGEEDPDVLEHLYLLDHLATRMRRNAESLLVLAGAESGPRRSKPVTVVDVVRGALSEVEEYERVEVGMMPEAVIHGPAVSDVAHLVAELLENATHFSPPDTHVRVDGARTGGSYQLVITDEGVGMPAEQLEELNLVLSDPPVTGLALGRALGCLVAARLAARHGITVRLRPGAHEGVSAHVLLPRHLLADEPGPTPSPGPTREVPDPAPDLAPDLATDGAADGSPAWELEWADALAPAEQERAAPARAASLPAEMADALPTRQAFDAGLQALLDGERAGEPAPMVEPAVESPTPPLRRRVPGATAEAPITVPDAGASRRDPDTVRAQLSRYRSGLLAGRVTESPPDEERS